MTEEEYGKGAFHDPEDNRDRPFAGVGEPFDWGLGFDIEIVLGFRQVCKDEAEFFGPRGRTGWGVDRYREIVGEVRARQISPFKIPTKDQGRSNSCVGQAAAYYIAVLNMIETGEYVEISARDIYAYIALQGGGAWLRDALRLSKDRGVATEQLVPSYNSGRVPKSEQEMLEKPEETENVKIIRRVLQSKEYQAIQYGNHLEDTAWAVLKNFGVLSGVDGENNGTWLSEYPKPPKYVAWGHGLYLGKVGIENGIKHIDDKNSWGDGAGKDGWQKLMEEWFADAGSWICHVFNPWTLTDKSNNLNEDMTLYKKRGTDDLYEKWSDGKYRKCSGPSYVSNRYGAGLQIIEADISDSQVAGIVGEEEWFRNTPINKW